MTGTSAITTWTWRELCEQAGSPGLARALIECKQVWRVLRGVYVGAEHPDGPQVRLAALERILPPDVALTGRAALWALGLDVLPLSQVLDIALPRGRNLRPQAGLAYRSLRVDDSELFELGTLLVVSPAKVVVDVARNEPLMEAVALGDAALRAGVTDLDLIELSLARAGGLRGIVAARELPQHLEPRAESLMESRLRMICVLGGLPRPEAQVDLYTRNGQHVGRTDLYLNGVALQYDGFDPHTQDKRVFSKDRSQRNSFDEIGVVARHFTSDDIYRKPWSALLGTVRRALTEARSRQRTAMRGPDTLRAPQQQPPLTLDRLPEAGSDAA